MIRDWRVVCKDCLKPFHYSDQSARDAALRGESRPERVWTAAPSTTGPPRGWGPRISSSIQGRGRWGWCAQGGAWWPD